MPKARKATGKSTSRPAPEPAWLTRLRLKQQHLEAMVHAGDTNLEVVAAAASLSRMLNDHEAAMKEHHERLYYLSRALTGEAFDNLGRFKEAREETWEGGAVSAKLPAVAVAAASTEDERRSTRDRVRYCLAYALSVYHQHHYEEARRIVTVCSNLASHGLVRPTSPGFGLRGQCSYLMGRVLRQLGKSTEAQDSFEEAIKYFYLRAEHAAKRSGDDAGRAWANAAFSMHRCGLCQALGAGWVQFSRGNLTQARRDTMAARLQLLQSSDLINRRYADVLLGSIIRSKAAEADKTTHLLEAEGLILNAYREFKRLGHDLYCARAACQLAFVYLRLNDRRAALEIISAAEVLANKIGDDSLLVEVLATKSRVVRMDAASNVVESREEAVRIAADALEVAKKSEKGESSHGAAEVAPALVIAARISRGVAYFHLNKHDKAREDLNEALRLNKRTPLVGANAETNSPIVAGTCHVFLAWSYARDKQADRAVAHFEDWARIAPQIEQQALVDRALEVKSEIDELCKDFVVKADVANLEYDTHKKALRSFLVRQADVRAKGGGRAKVAELLGVSRQALFDWEKKPSGGRKSRDRVRGGEQ